MSNTAIIILPSNEAIVFLYSTTFPLIIILAGFRIHKKKKKETKKPIATNLI